MLTSRSILSAVLTTLLICSADAADSHPAKRTSLVRKHEEVHHVEIGQKGQAVHGQKQHTRKKHARNLDDECAADPDHTEEAKSKAPICYQDCAIAVAADAIDSDCENLRRIRAGECGDCCLLKEIHHLFARCDTFNGQNGPDHSDDPVLLKANGGNDPVEAEGDAGAASDAAFGTTGGMMSTEAMGTAGFPACANDDECKGTDTQAVCQLFADFTSTYPPTGTCGKSCKGADLEQICNTCGNIEICSAAAPFGSADSSMLAAVAAKKKLLMAQPSPEPTTPEAVTEPTTNDADANSGDGGAEESGNEDGADTTGEGDVDDSSDDNGQPGDVDDSSDDNGQPGDVDDSSDDNGQPGDSLAAGAAKETPHAKKAAAPAKKKAVHARKAKKAPPAKKTIALAKKVTKPLVSDTKKKVNEKKATSSHGKKVTHNHL